MDRDPLTIESEVLVRLEDQLKSDVNLKISASPNAATRADALISSDLGPTYVVEVKYYGNTNQDLHFGTVAATAASARVVGDSAGHEVGGIIVTDGRIPDAVRDAANQMGISIYHLDVADPGSAVLSVVADLREEGSLGRT